jgi:hypothetical protein
MARITPILYLFPEQVARGAKGRRAASALDLRSADLRGFLLKSFRIGSFCGNEDLAHDVVGRHNWSSSCVQEDYALLR